MTRVALVTGAARGIGAATVRALAARDWAVLALDQCADDPSVGRGVPAGCGQEGAGNGAAGLPGRGRGQQPVRSRAEVPAATVSSCPGARSQQVIGGQ
jgi:NAD(P)-dependent dehydrogenase (short-subunit alcohol dehydrogenase family)